ncbi:MAG: nucleotide exchange factor GrpE, partial [Alistipes sp.]|nr:nucleotide exchange factor GrpE [Alistipes sp.]
MISHDNETKQTDNPQFKDNETENGAACGCESETTAEANLAEGGDSEPDNQSEGFIPPTPSEEAAVWKDKYMRLSAEFDNFRKRTLKEKMELAEYCGEGVIKSLLPVLDDMD